MKLINEKCPNMKFHIDGKEVSANAAGVIEVEGKHNIEALLVSGFKKLKVASKAELEAELEAEEIAEAEKAEAEEIEAAKLLAEAVDNVEPEAEVDAEEEKAKANKETKSWKRGK